MAKIELVHQFLPLLGPAETNFLAQLAKAIALKQVQQTLQHFLALLDAIIAQEQPLKTLRHYQNCLLHLTQEHSNRLATTLVIPKVLSQPIQMKLLNSKLLMLRQDSLKKVIAPS